jgi:hypothetical protein
MAGFTTLRHGTTLRRAERLMIMPPILNFRDPGGTTGSEAGGFSAVVVGATRLALGTPEEYADRKSKNFPAEGGPVIPEVEVPDEIVDIIRRDPILGDTVAGSGEIRFEPGYGWAELVQAWPNLVKRVIPL